MKKIYIIAGIVCLLYSCKKSNAGEVHVITAEEMNSHLKYSKDVQVVDVRPDVDYKESHLFNATNIIYDKNFKKNLKNLDKTRPVAIYCTSGSVSPEAAKILQEAGFKHIYLLDGGIKKWKSDITE